MSDDTDLDSLLEDIESGAAAIDAAEPVADEPAKKEAPAAMAKADPSSSKGSALSDRPQTFVNMDRFKDDVSFNIQDMQSAFVDQSALYVHYGHAKANANLQSKRFKQRLELLEAKMDTTIRKGAVASGEKLTEGAIKNRITASVGYQKAKEAQLEAEHIYEMLSEIVESFRHRRDMLIQAGADVRAEKQTSLRMKEDPSGIQKDLLAARAKTA